MKARVVLVGALLVLPPASARADVRQECVQAADEGQILRDQGKLVEARQRFVSCARDACPSVVANRCAEWLAEVGRELPSVTFRALDASGKELVDVSVLIDGTPTLGSLDGRSIPMNPGPHHVRFARVGDSDVDLDVIVHAGDRARAIEGRFARKAAALLEPAASSKSAGFHFPLLAGVSLGVSAVSFVTMGVLVGTTASDVNHLRSTCAGSCSASDVSSANTRIVVANVAMGLGIATAAGAGVLLVVANVGDHARAPDHAILLRAGPGSLAILGSF